MWSMDVVERQLRSYYEVEADRRLRPRHGARRRHICETFAQQIATDSRRVIDVGAGPATDSEAFTSRRVDYVGVDLAFGNARLAAGAGRTVIPASLFHLPFPRSTFSAGWSMSTFQHVPDERIDDALAEFVRVLTPGAPVAIGLWGGRDEVIDSASSTSGIQLPRHYTLRTHQRIRSILGRHLDVQSEDTFLADVDDWEYHVAFGSAPS